MNAIGLARAEPKNTIVSLTLCFSNRCNGSSYSQRIRIARAELLFKNSKFLKQTITGYISLESRVNCNSFISECHLTVSILN